MTTHYKAIDQSYLQQARSLLVHGLLLIILVTPSLAGATALSDAVASCTTVDQYCQLTGLATNIPLNLVDSDGGHNILEYGSKGVWSERDKKLIFYGQGHLTTPYLITYTEATDTWTRTQIGAAGNFRHSYSNNTANPLYGRWYYKDYASCTNIRRFNISNNSELAQSATATFGNNICYSGIEFFPDIGEVIFAGLENNTSYGILGFTDSASGTGSWERIGPSPGTFDVGTGDGQIVYNPVHRIILFGGSNQKMYVLSQNKQVRQVASAPCTLAITNPEFPILTVDPVSGDYILLCAGGATYKFDITNGANGTWTQIIASPPAFYGATGTQNGWFSIIAIPSITHGGIFFLECGGTSNCRGGQKPRLWFLRHKTPTAFDIKTQDPGVVYKEAFNRVNGKDRLYYADMGGDSVDCSSALAAAGLDHGYGFNAARIGPGNVGPSGSGGCHWPSADTTVSHLNGGSLRLSIPATANGSILTGQWTTWMRRLGDGNFFYVAPGSPYGNVINIQFYAKFDSGYTTLVSTCSGGCYGDKIDLIYGEPPNGSNSSTIEMTTVMYENGSSPATLSMVPAMYGQQGHDASYYNLGATDTTIGPQPLVNCTFSLGASCKRILADTWYEFTYRITVNPAATYQAYCAGGARSRVEFWIDGVKLVDNQCASIDYGSTDGKGVGSFEFNLYHTNGTGVNHAANAWFTELVISTNTIPFGSSGGVPSDTIPPAAPTNLRVQ